MKSVKTSKGTELPLINLKGKDYLQVAHRLVWFREERPEWSIVTEMVTLTDSHAIAKATIIDPDGRIIATAHKREDKVHFADFMEKAETSSIGRALALVGYGTQFAEELDEGDRVVDAPIERRAEAPKPASEAQQGGMRKPFYDRIKTSKWTKEQLAKYSQAVFGKQNAAELGLPELMQLAQVSTEKTFDEAFNGGGGEKLEDDFDTFQG